jgi:Zn-dependent M28 family amino/carboxypeptidase
MQLLESEGMDYELDTYQSRGNTCYNIILKGDSDRMVVAHHDIVNPNIDNANDNSASVINAIMIKKLKPEINVVLLDGEECGGLGSQRVSDQINDGYFNTIDWVLNLELTGKGGKYFFIGNYPGRLSDHIKSIFDCPITNTPYNDSVTFRKNGIDSVVINPIPPLNEGKSSVKWNDDTYLDFSMLYNCHSSKDTISTISVDDMKEFVEDVVIKILA